jgi:DNA invertase Pin-like site-specific DNA recombinase
MAAWAVDRLGRSLVDLLGFLGELHTKQVDLYLHQQGLDTSTLAGRAIGAASLYRPVLLRARSTKSSPDA